MQHLPVSLCPTLSQLKLVMMHWRHSPQRLVVQILVTQTPQQQALNHLLLQKTGDCDQVPAEETALQSQLVWLMFAGHQEDLEKRQLLFLMIGPHYTNGSERKDLSHNRKTETWELPTDFRGRKRNLR